MRESGWKSDCTEVQRSLDETNYLDLFQSWYGQKWHWSHGKLCIYLCSTWTLCSFSTIDPWYLWLRELKMGETVLCWFDSLYQPVSGNWEGKSPYYVWCYRCWHFLSFYFTYTQDYWENSSITMSEVSLVCWWYPSICLWSDKLSIAMVSVGPGQKMTSFSSTLARLNGFGFRYLLVPRLCHIWLWIGFHSEVGSYRFGQVWPSM